LNKYRGFRGTRCFLLWPKLFCSRFLLVGKISSGNGPALMVDQAEPKDKAISNAHAPEEGIGESDALLAEELAKVEAKLPDHGLKDSLDLHSHESSLDHEPKLGLRADENVTPGRANPHRNGRQPKEHTSSGEDEGKSNEDMNDDSEGEDQNDEAFVPMEEDDDDEASSAAGEDAGEEEEENTEEAKGRKSLSKKTRSRAKEDSAKPPASPSKKRKRGKTSWACPTCAKSFKTKPGLDYHVQKKVCENEGTPVASPSKPNLTCELCGKTLQSSQAFKYHVEKKVCQNKRTPGAKSKSQGGTPGSALSRKRKRKDFFAGQSKLSFPLQAPSVGDQASEDATGAQVLHSLDQEDAESRQKRDQGEGVHDANKVRFIQRQVDASKLKPPSWGDGPRPLGKSRYVHVTKSLLDLAGTDAIEVASIESSQLPSLNDYMREVQTRYNFEPSAAMPMALPPLTGTRMSSGLSDLKSPLEDIDAPRDLLINPASQVYALSFCPHVVHGQSFLAIGISPSQDTLTVLGASSGQDRRGNIVQVWAFSENKASPAVLSYIIEMPDWGTTLQLEWCPFAKAASDALGLLAVTSTAETVAILRMPVPPSEPTTTPSEGHVPLCFHVRDLLVYTDTFDQGVVSTALAWRICTDDRLSLLCGLSNALIVQLHISEQRIPNSYLTPRLDDLSVAEEGSSTLAATKAVIGVCMCPHDPNIAASVALDGYLRLWDLRRPAGPVSQLSLASRSMVRISSISWPPEFCDVVVVGDDSGRVVFVDLRSSTPHGFRVHQERVAGLASCSLTGRPLLASCSSDGLVGLWTADYSKRKRMDRPLTMNESDIFCKFSCAFRHNKNKPETEQLVLSSSFAKLPVQKGLQDLVPCINTTREHHRLVPPPKRVALRAVAWGPCESDQNVWVACGGFGGVVRVQQVQLTAEE